VDICIRKITTDLRKLASVEKSVLPGEQERGRDKILNGSNHRLSVAWCDKIMFDVHEFQSLSSGFLSLRDIWNINDIQIDA
jgi:hypothetical protein